MSRNKTIDQSRKDMGHISKFVAKVLRDVKYGDIDEQKAFDTVCNHLTKAEIFTFILELYRMGLIDEVLDI